MVRKRRFAGIMPMPTKAAIPGHQQECGSALYHVWLGYSLYLVRRKLLELGDSCAQNPVSHVSLP